jgi:hypothetical protein
MFEARVAPGRLADAIAWVRAEGIATALASGARAAEGFQAGADGDRERIVLITRWADRAAAAAYAEAPPAGVLARGAGWVFEAIPPAEEGSPNHGAAVAIDATTPMDLSSD